MGACSKGEKLSSHIWKTNADYGRNPETRKRVIVIRGSFVFKVVTLQRLFMDFKQRTDKKKGTLFQDGRTLFGNWTVCEVNNRYAA